MNQYVVLLRGINVGGKNKIKMDQLRAFCKDIGATEIKTYIQSGNIVLRTTDSPETVSENLVDLILKELGYKISVITLEADRFKSIVSEFPFAVKDESKSFIVFFGSATSDAEFPNSGPDQIKLTKNSVYIDYPNGVSGATIPITKIEKEAGLVNPTTRNLRTARKLLSLLG